MDRAAWHQADWAGLVLCSDLPRGYMERLYYHHPPPLIQTTIKSSPYPLASYNLLCDYRASWTQSLYYQMISCWNISSFCVSKSLDSQCIELKRKDESPLAYPQNLLDNYSSDCIRNNSSGPVIVTEKALCRKSYNNKIKSTALHEWVRSSITDICFNAAFPVSVVAFCFWLLQIQTFL